MVKPFVQDVDFTLHLGDVREVLAGLPDESVHCVVTSPPYWGLRDYGTGTWEGGDPDCDHVEQYTDPTKRPASGGVGNTSQERSKELAAQQPNAGAGGRKLYRDVCGKCGATRVDQQLGLEPTPEAYVARMVAVFAEVRRVLRADGVCWLNIGDSYLSNVGGGSDGSQTEGGVAGHVPNAWGGLSQSPVERPSYLKPKDLAGMPWRLAFALQADGWCLRSEVIWAKPNPMPESVTDRPTKAHEQLFLLTKATWKGGPIQPWPMNREDAIWLAALVDGEGSICFQERERADCENSVGPRLSIVNTNRALLERVTEITSLDVNQTPQPRTRSNGDSGRPVYSWQVTNEKAARIIAAIRPHLIAKREQSELALYVHVLNQKHKGRGGHVTSSSDLALKRKAAAACSALNHGEAVDLSWFAPVATGRWVPNPYSYDADAIREKYQDGPGLTGGAYSPPGQAPHGNARAATPSPVADPVRLPPARRRRRVMASLRTVDRREEVDPADIAVVCGSCGCEVDVSPEPHSPKCGAPA